MSTCRLSESLHFPLPQPHRGTLCRLTILLHCAVEPPACWGLGSPHVGQDPLPPAPTPSPFSIEIDQKLQEIMKQTGYLTIGGQVT